VIVAGCAGGDPYDIIQHMWSVCTPVIIAIVNIYAVNS